ncbi:MAG: MoaD/ThiS family protein [Dehalococcoidia bacterium]|jgi:molybdopterin synthase sulfur carrier subunit|nr:molybdopterin synthase sulfur carrier subunit [Chloroflexota bacterium]MDP6056190.1 MoaD/ThiS family protein [Dehalococcoidia bacterium]MDP7262458.1 MoaD/ThiS family protein [Dehalococcoidia bacterium]MDP7485050.1 MoaD/ThiS family protein [Dehalococcoidia bacterium]|tara:strand:- start:3950 stop:4231 length:282 start_codon:yes stop_codon:yes gene_type:complete
MAVTVKIPTPLRKLTNGETSVDTDGSTIGAIVDALELVYPGMKERLVDDSGELRHFVNIYLNGEDVRYLDGLASAVADRDELSIVPAVAGGLK